MTRTSPLTVVGELILTFGLVVLLFAGYELWGTDQATAQAQGELSGELDREWAQQPDVAVPVPADPGTATPAGTTAGVTPQPTPGRPFLKIYIPHFPGAYVRTVLEGVDQGVLADGPGHYPGTGLPGALGNVAIAGHRVGHGAPFDPAGTLRSCDAIVLETRESWFVYRLLPMADEQSDWAARAAGRPGCEGVAPLDGPYAGLAGSEVVLPSQGEVVAPVPHQVGAAPTASLVTLTTCNPRFSARQRLIVHAAQTGRVDKRDHEAGWRPDVLTEA